ncbi:MAG: urease accessory protein UreD [Candidatus Eremiobacteraeota bacterium]|nr:urease accessory protein UreD [Candidatus Eremiobacteraeota bacterium]
MRQEGLARCSRPLSEPQRAGAARLIVSQLGPGFVRGDRFLTEGELCEGADLVVAGQAATRLLGGTRPSEALATWRLGRDANLFISGEPSVAYDGATHLSRGCVTLAEGASLAWLDAIVAHGRFARVTTALRVYFDGRLAIHDVLALTPERLGEALGTAHYVRAGIAPERSLALVAVADEAATRACAGGSLRIGVGSPAAGGVVMRARGRQVRDVRAALFEILHELRRFDRPAHTAVRSPDVPFG